MATKIYQLQDQHLGVIQGHTWMSRPSAAQLAPIIAKLGQRDLVDDAQAANAHTAEQMATGPVTHASGWCFVVESTLYDEGEIPPDAPAPVPSSVGFSIGSGIGSIK